MQSVVSERCGDFFAIAATIQPGTTGMLLGYVEYFGFLRAVVLLSETYIGPNIENCYAIDPTTGIQFNLSVRLQFSQADMVDIFDYKHCDNEATKQAADAVFGPGVARKR
ncbi:hypothetical protein AD942_01655 [Gluconobacter japonicus]|nr:hypothetical protein AD936_22455 [Gluconobacter japonicus]KXV41615.1 hypothetical protein AD942_01655 [Gluconobacter japonicus]